MGYPNVTVIKDRAEISNLALKTAEKAKIDHTKLFVTEYQATSVTKLTCSEIILGLGIWLLY